MPHQKDKIILNALNLSFQNNFSQLRSFLKHYSSYSQAWKALSPSKKYPAPIQAWKELQKKNISFLLPTDNNYPSLLKEISFPPQGIYIQGSFFSKMTPLAVVGTRKISNYGKIVTEQIVKKLITYNVIIISGLAQGVDTIAHSTALNNGGKTIAVLGSGLDKIFPSSNKSLARKIISNGAVISEYPLGTSPYPYYFPQRNRIISGLSKGTLVIEAPKKSGALITAHFALEQNREVFAVPGSIFNPNSEGTNKLIQEGAKLVSTVQDILEELNIPFSPTPPLPLNLNKQESKIYHNFLVGIPITIDELMAKTNLSSAEILISLSTLELKGLIKTIEGGRYIRI